MLYYWWVRQRLEEKSGQGPSRKKTKGSFAPVVEVESERTAGLGHLRDVGQFKINSW